MKHLLIAVFAIIPMLASCEPEKKTMSHPTKEIPAGAVTETATLGGGCYWCLEAAYRQLDGVYSVGTTGHAEVVNVVFDPEKISFERLLAWFWDLHDPTTLNRQGNDVGTQYRSAIFYHSDTQKKIAEASKAAAGKNFKNPIVTEITKASAFYPAPADHQDYYFQNKSKNPYCSYVIEPKLKKLKLDH